MFRPHVILIPGVLVAVLFVIMATAMIARPGMAEAFSGFEPPTLATPDPALVTSSNHVPPKVDSGLGETSRSDQDCSLPRRYPDAIRRWCSLIETYARKAGMDPRLVAAVMLQESGGNPNAYSSSGAVGLMQVMPRDGLAAEFKCNGRPCFASRPSMADLYDPEFNISYGVRMLTGLCEKYGNTRDALKAYGPMDGGYSYADKVLRIFENYR